MKLPTALSVLPFLAGASAVPTAQKPAPFDVMAVSEGDLQYHALAASSSFFYIGGKSETSSSCPIDVQKKGGCPPGDTTVFKNANFLDSVVGNQRVYVDHKGNVRLTGTDEAGMEPGAKIDGFKYIPGDRYGEWTYESDDGSVKGLMACPYNKGINGIHQVLVNSKDAQPPSPCKIEECVPFKAGAFEYTLPKNGTAPAAGAWSY